MAAQTTTSMRITTLLAPYRFAHQPPPFSDAEVIAMILLLVGQPLTFELLLAHITSNIFHFAILAAEELVNLHHNLPYRFGDALRQYDLPIIFDNGEYRMRRTEGVFFLRQWLPSDLTHASCTLLRPLSLTNTPFRFFNLPAEIRNVIYEMVFAFPRSGIRIRCTPNNHGRNFSRHKATVMTRHLTETISFDEWDAAAASSSRDRRRPIHLPPLSELLQLCTANRQFYNESHGIFYSKNRFHCLSIVDLQHFLNTIPDSYRRLLNHISFRYNDPQRLQAPAAIRIMNRMPSLQKLTMHVDLDVIEKHQKRDGTPTYSDLGTYPGLRMLARVSTLDRVEIVGDGDEVAVCLKGMNMQLKVYENDVEVPNW